MPTPESQPVGDVAPGRGASLWLIAGQLAYVGLGYLLTVGLARILGVREFGAYAVVLTIATWVGIVAANGVPQVVTQRLAGGIGARAATWRAALRLQIGLSIGLLVGLAALAPLLARLLDQPDLALPIALAGLALPGIAIVSLELARVNAGFAFGRGAVVQVAWSVARTGGALLGAALGGLDWALVAIAVSAVPGIVAAGRARFADGGHAEGGLLRAAAVTSGVALLLVVIGTYDLLVLTALRPDDAGLYAAAQNLARIPLYLAIPVAAAVLPHAAAHARGSERLGRELELALVVICLPAAVLVAQPAGLVELVFGPRYGAAGGVVQILAVALALLGIATVAASALIGAGARRRAALAAAAGLAVGLLAVDPLTDRLGADGAALSTALAAGTAATLAVTWLARVHREVLRAVAVWRVAVAAVAVGLAAWLPGDRVLAALAAAAVVGLAAVALLRLPPRTR